MARPAIVSAVEIAQYVRQRILDGEYKPGSHLSENRILSDFGQVFKTEPSRAAVRQAVGVLESEGFVRVMARIGAIVCDVDRKAQVREVIDTRLVIEEFIVSQLATQRSAPDLRAVSAVNEEMLAFVEAARRQPTRDPAARLPDEYEAVSRFVALDAQFHHCLAEAVGSVSVSETLKGLRQKLDAIAQPQPFGTGGLNLQRMSEVVKEHDAILQALDRNGSPPDVNQAQWALRHHLRNSAKNYRYPVSDLRYDTRDKHYDYLFDLPEVLEPRELPNDLMMLRLSTEVAIVRRLVARNNSSAKPLRSTETVRSEEVPAEQRLLSVEKLNEEMTMLALRNQGQAKVRDDDVVRFLNLDSGLHCGLGLLSGLLFAEPLIRYAFSAMFPLERNSLNPVRMLAVVGEHTRIINSIREGDQQEAEEATIQHIVAAICSVFPGNEAAQKELRDQLTSGITAWRAVEFLSAVATCSSTSATSTSRCPVPSPSCP